jgi:hypothetical protein
MTKDPSPPRILSREAFAALAAANGLAMSEAELAELHEAHGALARLLTRLDAAELRTGETWPDSVVAAWER